MENIDELLPIGSVIVLKEGQKKLMIFGIKQTDEETNVEYDYIGVLYPEGNIGKGGQFLFNHKNIEEVFFKGFEDDERKDFIEKLAGFYKDGADRTSNIES